MVAGSSERGHKCTCEVCTASAVQCDGQLQVRAEGEEEEEEPLVGERKGQNQPSCCRGSMFTLDSNVFLCFSRANCTMGNHVRHGFVLK